MENKILKTVFAVVHGGSKRLTKNGNFLVMISGVDDLGKITSVIFYASSDLKEYRVSEQHEINRGLPFDRSEWKRSNSWGFPATRLSNEQISSLLNLWNNREQIIYDFINGDPKLLRDKNNRTLIAMGQEPLPEFRPATNSMGDFFKKSQKSN
jgi:hypothetical protein